MFVVLTFSFTPLLPAVRVRVRFCSVWCWCFSCRGRVYPPQKPWFFYLFFKKKIPLHTTFFFFFFLFGISFLFRPTQLQSLTQPGGGEFVLQKSSSPVLYSSPRGKNRKLIAGALKRKCKGDAWNGRCAFRRGSGGFEGSGGVLKVWCRGCWRCGRY